MAEAQSRSSLTFLEGDVSLAQAHGTGAMADASVRFSAQAFKDTFIDGAKGDALTALVDDHLNLQRQEASAATVTARFTRTGGGGATTITLGTTIATSTLEDGSEVHFTTNADVAVGAGNNGPFDVLCTCTEAGRQGNVAAALITRILVTIPNGPWSVTNVNAAAGGNDEETDDELRRRARTHWQTLRRGTLAALEFGALQVASVRVAVASEDATGLVTVRVTDSDGNSNLDMIADVVAELENWRAAGSVVQVTGGTRLELGVTATLTLEDGVDITVLTPLVQDAIEARIRKLLVGQTLYEDMLTAAVVAVDPDGIRAVSFTYSGASPDGNGNIVPGANVLLRPGAITVLEA